MFDRTVFATMCRLCLCENAELVSVHSKSQSNPTSSTRKATQITRQHIERITTITVNRIIVSAAQLSDEFNSNHYAFHLPLSIDATGRQFATENLYKLFGGSESDVGIPK